MVLAAMDVVEVKVLLIQKDTVDGSSVFFVDQMPALWTRTLPSGGCPAKIVSACRSHHESFTGAGI